MSVLGKVTKSPDYVSAVIGYRSWKCDDFGLTSMNGISWNPGKELHFLCVDRLHTQPEENCSCGIYAAKSLEILGDMGYASPYFVWGEVQLWGKVIEHDLGYRAEFAYPKSLIVPFKSLPFYLKGIEDKVTILSKYSDLIQAKVGEDMMPLWERDFGIYHNTVEKIFEIINLKWNRVQAAIPRTPQIGDRIWIHQNAGIITEVHSDYIEAKSRGSRLVISRKNVKFTNNRWESTFVTYVIGGSF